MTKKVMVVASAGGHWVQLLRMQPAWADQTLTYVTTDPGFRALVAERHPGADFHAVSEGNQKDRLRLLLLVWQLFWLILRKRPDVVISTGAAPGYFALRIGKIFRAKTIWVDSMANAEELSMSGRMIGKHADVWLTQWEHLAKPDGPHFAGCVL